MSVAWALPRELATATGSVTVTDQGSHLVQWLVDGVPVIWVSDRATYAPGRAVRGGVPVCWPWFADGPDQDRTPSHGLLRTALWQPVHGAAAGQPPTSGGSGEDTGAGPLLLAWRITHEDVAGQPGTEVFPHPFTAELTVTVGQDCTVQLSVTNTGDVPFVHEAALHTYLHVGDARRARVHGLEGTAYFDKVSRQHHRQEGPLVLEGEVDRIYRATGPVRVHDPVLGRVITLTGAGTTDTVVWNPGQVKGTALADLGEGWEQMLCVEAAALSPRCPPLEPGQTMTLSTRIGVDPADGGR